MIYLFRKKIEKELDYNSLNDILRTGKKLINIGFFMAIIALILLGTYLIKEWHILKYIGEFLTVISPIFLGFIIAWLCVPAVNFLQKKKIPHLPSCLIVYLGVILLIILLVWALIPQLITQVGDFAHSLPDIISQIKNFSDKIFASISSPLIKSFKIQEQIYKGVEGFANELTTNLPQKIFNVGKSIISGGLNITLGLMIGFYVLYDFDKINERINNLLPGNWRANYKDLCSRINDSLRSYVQGLFLVMFLVFITQSIGLTIAGLKAPLIFALFCAITDVIPYFGPYIGAIPAVIVGFTISPVVGICVIIAIVVVQLLENNFYQPLIMGHTMKLHPVTIMIGLLVFENFFGILGMIIATPTIACLKVILKFADEKVNLRELDSKSNNKIQTV